MVCARISRTLLIVVTVIAAALPAKAQSRPDSAESRGAQLAALLQKLDSADPDVVTEAADAIFEIHPLSDAPIPRLTALLESRDPEMRASAAFALIPYGPRAQAALPSLAKMLREDRARHGGRGAALALFAIDRTGTTAIPAICALDDGPLPGFFTEVPGLIKEAGVKNYRAAARPHGARLARVLARNPTYELAQVLLDLALDPKDLVPVFGTMIEKKLDELPHNALMRADPAGAVAVPVLARLVADPDPAVRIAAVEEIKGFGPKAREAIPALLAIFRGLARDADAGGWEHRRKALRALAAIGLSPLNVADVVEQVRHAPSSIRAELLEPLSRLDPEGAMVVPILVAQLAEAPFELRMRAVDALSWLGPKAAPAVPALLKLLATLETDLSRGAIVSALGAIGPGAAEARPILIAQLADVDSLDAQSARSALAAIGAPLTPAEVSELAETVRASPKSDQAVVAAQRLGLAGAAAKDALPVLIAAIRADSRQLKIAAIWSIGALGPDAASAVPDLLRLLSEESGDLLEGREDATSLSGSRQGLLEYAISALGRIGASSKPALPLLARLPAFLGGDLAIRRIDPPARRPLEIVVDPTLVVSSSGDPETDPSHSIPIVEPEGSFRLVFWLDQGLQNYSGSIFISKNGEGRLVATCDLSFTTCVSSACWGPTAVTAGTLTLRSADLDSGKPIVGILTVTRIEGGERDDPFEPALTFPFQSPDPFAAPTSRPR